MDTMTRTSRRSYAAAFGATAYLICEIVVLQKKVIDVDGSTALESFVEFLSMIVYGLVFLPLFASLALDSAFSNGVGTLYAWMLLIIEVYRASEFDLTPEDRLILIAFKLPALLCRLYLAVSLPARFIIALKQGVYWVGDQGETMFKGTLEDIDQTFQARHVQKLLRKSENKIVISKNDCWNKISKGLKDIFKKMIYKRTKGFLYPAQLISVLVVAAIIVYTFTVGIMVILISNLNKKEKLLKELPTNSDREEIIFHILVLKGCIIITFCIALAISLINILRIMTSFRENLFAMYRGDYRFIPSPYNKDAVSLCIGSMEYAGFQVAYITWAYVLTCLIIFVSCFIIITLLYFLIHEERFRKYCLDKILGQWPAVTLAILFFIVQSLMAKCVFLQGGGRWLRLDNRRFFFVFTYFMFWCSIFLGFLSCLKRLLKALVVGVLFLGRLDISTLPRKFESFDPGFDAYQGYIHMEAAHTHPVVITFIRLLSALRNERMRGKEMSAVELNMDHSLSASKSKGTSSRATERMVNIAARFRWHVAYTLLTNPDIRVYRKGYIQALKIAKKEGIRVPMSDKIVTDFDLVKSLEEHQKQKEKQIARLMDTREDEDDQQTKGLLSCISVENDQELCGCIGKPAGCRGLECVPLNFLRH